MSNVGRHVVPTDCGWSCLHALKLNTNSSNTYRLKSPRSAVSDGLVRFTLHDSDDDLDSWNALLVTRDCSLQAMFIPITKSLQVKQVPYLRKQARGLGWPGSSWFKDGVQEDNILDTYKLLHKRRGVSSWLSTVSTRW